MVQFRELNTDEPGHALDESDAPSFGEASASSTALDYLHGASPFETRLVPVTLPPDQAEIERLGDEIAELAAHVHAATYQLLVRLREFDERNGWAGGFKSCAHWLSWRTSIAPVAAREKVRVARALVQLPLLSDAMRRGELSYAKVRCATRVATPVNESELLMLARHATAAQMEKVVRGWRRVNRQAELEAPVKDLKQSHIDRDVEISAWTPTPLWQGERLDLDYAVRSYVRLAAAQEGGQPIE